MCPSASVACVRLSVFVSVTCGECAVSSPGVLVVVPSGRLSCPALAVLVRFCLVLAGLVSGGCGARRPGWFLHVGGVGALSGFWMPCVGSWSGTVCVSGLCLCVYGCVMGVAPGYLCDLVALFGDALAVEGGPGLRSSSGAAGLLIPRWGGGGWWLFLSCCSWALGWIADSVGGGVCACLRAVAGNAFVPILAVSCLYFCLASFLPIFL